VLAFGVGLAADSFAVGDFGRFQRQVHVIALVQLGDHHFDVLLAGTGKKKFLGLRVAREMQRGIFFQNFVDRNADLVFVGAGLGFNRKSDGRFGGWAFIKIAVDLSPSVSPVAVSSVWRLRRYRRHEARVLQSAFTLHDLHVLKALRQVAVVIHQGGVIFSTPLMTLK
jgi:hypothetical protein